MQKHQSLNRLTRRTTFCSFYIAYNAIFLRLIADMLAIVPAVGSKWSHFGFR